MKVASGCSTLLLMLCLVLCGNLAVAPPSFAGGQIPYRQYTTDHGLAHSTVFRSFQDSRGYMWFGTEYGLSRFDGRRFENFEWYDGFKARQVLGFAETSDGAVWINTYDGVVHKYHRGRLQPVQDGGGQFPRSATDIYAGGDDTIWLISELSGLLVCLRNDSIYALSLDKGLHYPMPASYVRGKLESTSRINDVKPGPGNSLLIASSRGAYLYDDRGLHLLNTDPELNGIISGLDVAPDGSIWLGVYESLVRLTANGRIQRRYTHGLLRNSFVRQAIMDPFGQIWVGGKSFALGLIADDTMQDLSDELGVNNIEINDICIDREGNAWLATFGAGLYCVPDVHRRNYTSDHGLSNENVISITEDQDHTLWLGTHKGLCSLRNLEIGRISLPKQNLEAVLRSDRRIESLGVDSSGGVWVGRHSENLLIDKTGSISLIDTVGMYVFYADRSGRILCAGIEDQYEIVNDSILAFDSLALLKPLRVYAMYRHRSGALWLGLESGAARLTDDSLRVYTAENNCTDSRVNAICEDRQGRLWFAADDGLYCRRQDTWRRYGRKDGLNHEACTSLALDNSGTLWIGTIRGLHAMLDSTIILFNKQRGLLAEEVRTTYVDRSNKLWVGTTSGLSMLRPQRAIQPVRPAPPVYINSVAAFGRTVLEARGLELGHDSASFEIAYAGIGFNHPESIVFQHRLVGFDNDWQTSRSWTRDYNNLAPGEYDFLLRARIDNSPWSDPPAQLSIVIRPPFWQTWWFRSISLLLLLGAVYGAARYRVERRRRREMEQLEIRNQMMHLEKRALDASINPHFMFNALNSIQFFFNKREHLLHANTYLARFARLIRMILEDTHKDVITMEEELQRLRLYLELEKMRLGERLDYAIELPDDLDVDAITIPMLIIQPYVENAIWHGISPLKEGGKVSISIKAATQHQLVIEIVDNGIGVRASKAMRMENSLADDALAAEDSSRGMSITHERLDLLSRLSTQHSDVHIGDAAPGNTERPGTRVVIRMNI